MSAEILNAFSSFEADGIIRPLAHTADRPGEPKDASTQSPSVMDTESVIFRQQKEETNHLRRFLETDHACLITGSDEDNLRATYLVNAIPSGSRKSALLELKKRTEEHLTYLELNGERQFDLDGGCNVMLLQDRLHRSLDMYGAWSFWIDPHKLFDILNQLQTVNEDWDARHKSDPGAPRNLKIHENNIFNIHNVTFKVIVFHPKSLCGTNVHPVYVARFDASNAVSWTPTVPTKHGELLLCADGKPIEFKWDLGREEKDHLSLLAVLVNMMTKVEAYLQDAHADPGVLKYLRTNMRNITKPLLEAIFHVPHPAQRQALAIAVRAVIEAANQSSHKRQATPPLSSLSAASHLVAAAAPEYTLDATNTEVLSAPTRNPQDQDVESKTEDAEADEQSDRLCEAERSDDEQSDDDSSEDVLPNLTADEHRMLYEQIRSGTGLLSTREASMMMLFGATGLPQFSDRP